MNKSAEQFRQFRVNLTKSDLTSLACVFRSVAKTDSWVYHRLALQAKPAKTKRRQTPMVRNSILRDSAALVWLDVWGRRSWNGTAGVGVAELHLASRRWNVAEDQLPSPWSLGAPTGRDICQRESWQLYFLSHLGLSLIHPSCSLSPPYTFLPESSNELYVGLLCSVFDPHVLSPSYNPGRFRPTSPPIQLWRRTQFLAWKWKTLPASIFPSCSLSPLHVGVDYALALHMTVLASWAKAWRHAGGQY